MTSKLKRWWVSFGDFEAIVRATDQEQAVDQAMLNWVGEEDGGFPDLEDSKALIAIRDLDKHNDVRRGETSRVYHDDGFILPHFVLERLVRAGRLTDKEECP